MNRLSQAQDDYNPVIINAINALAAVVEANNACFGSLSVTKAANEKIQEFIPLLDFSELKKILFTHNMEINNLINKVPQP